MRPHPRAVCAHHTVGHSLLTSFLRSVGRSRTPPLSRCRKRERSGRWRQSAAAVCWARAWPSAFSRLFVAQPRLSLPHRASPATARYASADRLCLPLRELAAGLGRPRTREAPLEVEDADLLGADRNASPAVKRLPQGRQELLPARLPEVPVGHCQILGERF